jgi:hypothetical protein
MYVPSFVGLRVWMDDIQNGQRLHLRAPQSGSDSIAREEQKILTVPPLNCIIFPYSRTYDVEELIATRRKLAVPVGRPSFVNMVKPTLPRNGA